VSEWQKKEKERTKETPSHISLAGKGRKKEKEHGTESRNGLKAKPNKPLPSLL
jgi:hypothetical protein